MFLIHIFFSDEVRLIIEVSTISMLFFSITLLKISKCMRVSHNIRFLTLLKNKHIITNSETFCFNFSYRNWQSWTAFYSAHDWSCNISTNDVQIQTTQMNNFIRLIDVHILSIVQFNQTAKLHFRNIQTVISGNVCNVCMYSLSKHGNQCFNGPMKITHLQPFANISEKGIFVHRLMHCSDNGFWNVKRNK